MKIDSYGSLFESILSPEDFSMIRKESAAAKDLPYLPDILVRLIHHREWLKIMEPLTTGGQALALPRVALLFEALAFAEGSLGWCVNLGAGANLFAGYFDEATARALFEGNQTWCAGSGFIGGKAYRCKNGFRLSGQWKYASGSRHASHFTANAFLYDEAGKPIMENGEAMMRSFIFPAHQVSIKDTWQVMGLRATNSNDFAVEGLFVPENHLFSLLKPSAFASEAIFKFPFETLAVVNMTVMMSGMMLHFLELFEALLTQKTPLNSGVLLGKNEALLGLFDSQKVKVLQARDDFYQALQLSWEAYEKGQQASIEQLDDLKRKSLTLSQEAREAVFHLYPYCGMSIIYPSAPINKVWRDFKVAGQHYVLQPPIASPSPKK